MKQWIDAGAVIGMGTDSETPMNFHTEALWREIKVFVDLGMSPQAAISAATRVNARRGAQVHRLRRTQPRAHALPEVPGSRALYLDWGR